jgi:hypothetical protein
MKQLNKTIKNVTYAFFVDTENSNPNFLTVVVSVVENQRTQFSKLDEKSSILKDIAIETAHAINDNFKLILNPYDSGIEWRGQFKLLSF